MTVNISLSTIRTARDAERALAIGYAPADRREGLAALFALDATLGAILRSTREPLVGQMRLTWWHQALTALDDAGPPPAEPVLQGLARAVMPHGISGHALAGMIDGWEALLEADVIDGDAMRRHAACRGAALFVLAGRLLGGGIAPLAAAGEGWALADLGDNLSDDRIRSIAVASARERLATTFATRWDRAVRPLGAMALAARMDVAPEPRPPGHPARVARLLLHRMTGR